MTESREWTTRSTDQTEAAGSEFADSLRSGDLVSLEGDLGAGKTVFARGLGAGLGLDPQTITSPSYVLAVEHLEGRIPLLHVDLYRLADNASVDALGIDEMLDGNGIVLAEWGQRLPEDLRKTAWIVFLTRVDDTTRTIRVTPPQETYSSR